MSAALLAAMVAAIENGVAPMDHQSGAVVPVGPVKSVVPTASLAGLKLETQTQAIGVIQPPPDIRAIVDKTAQFVAKNGMYMFMYLQSACTPSSTSARKLCCCLQALNSRAESLQTKKTTPSSTSCVLQTPIMRTTDTWCVTCHQSCCLTVFHSCT